MRPVIKMLLLLALIIVGAAIFFVVLDDEDTGAVSLAGMPRATGAAPCPSAGVR